MNRVRRGHHCRLSRRLNPGICKIYGRPEEGPWIRYWNGKIRLHSGTQRRRKAWRKNHAVGTETRKALIKKLGNDSDEDCKRIDERDNRIEGAVGRVDAVQQIFSERLKYVRDEVESTAEGDRELAETIRGAGPVGVVGSGASQREPGVVGGYSGDSPALGIASAVGQGIVPGDVGGAETERWLQERNICDQARETVQAITESGRELVEKPKSVLV